MDHSILNVHGWIRHEPDILRTAGHHLPRQDVFVFQIKVEDMVGIYHLSPEGQSPSSQRSILDHWEHQNPHLSQYFLIPFPNIAAGSGRNRGSFSPEGQSPSSQHFILDHWEHNSPHLSQDFLIPFPDIAGSGRNRARHVIHEMLGEVGIPRQKRRPLLGKIYSEAMRLAKQPDADGEGEYKRIPIMVTLRRVYARTVDVELEEDMETVVPASRSSEIEGLETVRVKETEVCAVCLDEMEAESEVTMLPCKHIFHGRCIDAWLVKASLCPLCRFQLSFTSPTIFEDGWN